MATPVSTRLRARAAAGSVRAGALGLLDRPLASYYLILSISVILIGLGLVMVLSASSVESYRITGSSYTVFLRQAGWGVFGLVLLLVGARMPVRLWRWLSYPLLLVSIALLCLVLVPGMGVSVNGNQNWLELGGLRVQPSEAAKLALVLWGADLLARKERLLVQWKHLLVPLVPVSAVVTCLVLAGGDLGTSLVLLAVIGALLFFAGAPLRLFGSVMVLAAGLVTWLILSAPYRVERLRSWLDPFADYENRGWQGAHGIFALASGGWWGEGLGASKEKWGLLPEADTDFIFAVIGEELGLVGTVMVLALFLGVTVAGFRIAVRTEDCFIRLAAAAITSWILVQALVNIGAVLGLVPITGIPLPLVSRGGSSLLPTMLALGILLSFARIEPGAAAALAERRAVWRERLRPARGRTVARGVAPTRSRD